MIAEYESMVKECKFETIDTVGRTVDDVEHELRSKIEPVVRRPRKIDPSLLDPKALDIRVER